MIPGTCEFSFLDLDFHLFVIQPAITCSELTTETLEQGEKICSKLKNTTERRHWHRSGVFSINSEHISHLNVVFILLTLLSWKIPAGKYRN